MRRSGREGGVRGSLRTGTVVPWVWVGEALTNRDDADPATSFVELIRVALLEAKGTAGKLARQSICCATGMCETMASKLAASVMRKSTVSSRNVPLGASPRAVVVGTFTDANLADPATFLWIELKCAAFLSAQGTASKLAGLSIVRSR